MKYDMYDEVLEQPISLEKTLKAEKSHMKEIAEKLKGCLLYTSRCV